MRLSNQLGRAFTTDFQYGHSGHSNPYNQRMALYDDFVLCDHCSEQNPGRWNSEVFKRTAPLHLEIGSGYGEFMINFCAQNPHINFVGLDYRFKRSFQVARKLSLTGAGTAIAENPPGFFRFLRAKGERISFIFAENEVDVIYLFFPDPWPKNRHHKKRLLQRSFLENACKVLRPGGLIYIKTDHDGYYQWMLDSIFKFDHMRILFSTCDLWGTFDTLSVLSAAGSTANCNFAQQEHLSFLRWTKTKFEEIFLQQNIKIKAIVLQSGLDNIQRELVD
ncbi:MAG: tRNA (guanosine(46)-N7)-methyltransferase TrmB [Oligoflexia bacterium]|nr:tRNA (guanosine(46)-N7)-methyltransferase TrmB [Oligoflexia bacterium]